VKAKQRSSTPSEDEDPKKKKDESSDEETDKKDKKKKELIQHDLPHRFESRFKVEEGSKRVRKTTSFFTKEAPEVTSPSKKRKGGDIEVSEKPAKKAKKVEKVEKKKKVNLMKKHQQNQHHPLKEQLKS